MWAAIAGAALAVLAASGKDRAISSYAVENTPIYGSTSSAEKASDVLSGVSIGAAIILYAVKYYSWHDRPADYAFYTIHADGAGVAHSHLPPAEAFGAAAVSGLIALPAVDQLKKHTERPRPDGSGNTSYPSGHTALAAWLNCYSAQTVAAMDLPPLYGYSAYGVLTALTIGVAWGRVEGHRHYPSDILAAALISATVTDAAFAYFSNDARQTRGTRLELKSSLERGGRSTTIAAVVDF